MSGESFLSRWSRRKREQEGAEAPETRADAASPSTVRDTNAPQDATLPAPSAEQASGPVADPANAPVDPAELPDIETMDVTKDLTPWLKRNVPDAWKQAALRKLWLTDPHVRAHVPFADYAWDWNTPGGVPGSGPLGPLDDVTKMASDILRGYGNPEPDVHSVAITEEARPIRGEMSHMRQLDGTAASEVGATDPRGPDGDAAPQQEVESLQLAVSAPEKPVFAAIRLSSAPEPAGRPALPSPPSLAPQQADGAQEKGRRRRHGGALPE